MATEVTGVEEERMAIQRHLDSQKTALERNVMGQFATPTALAQHILNYALTLTGQTLVRFFDPAFGTGSFYSALREVFSSDQIESATAFEIDPHYGEPARRLWSHTGLDLHLEDFTAVQPVGNETLIVCNPPYIRHHHIPEGDKGRLKLATQDASGMKLSGLAGMYCHFLGLAHPWMAPGALAAWLIPSEFMDVNYGREIKRYLTDTVNLIHIHRFDPHDTQFDDALVSSCVVWLRNEAPNSNTVQMSYGGSLHTPRESVELSKSQLRSLTKWSQATKPVSEPKEHQTTIGDWFRVRRGIATGDNSFFILTRQEAEKQRIPGSVLRPILPSSRNLPDDEIAANDQGFPLVEKQLVLIDCALPEEVVRSNHSGLWEYLEEGRSRGVADTYLASRRNPWYSQEQRRVPPIICTYMGRPSKNRAAPFRFIRNHSQAIASNVYLLFEPKLEIIRLSATQPDIVDLIWKHLRGLSAEQLMKHGRTYGGGLHKLEPRELMAVSIELAELAKPPTHVQQRLVAD